MKELKLQRPNPRQELFLKDSHRYIAFGGARGGGKSWAVRVKSVLLAFRYPGIKIMIVRKTYPELRANHISPMRTLLGDFAVYRDTTKEFIFPNSSVIMFRHCQNDSDMDKYQGTETDVLFIDEATQFTEEQFMKFKACVRGVNSFPKRVYLTCNPGGIGHTFVKRLFIDRAYNENERAEDYSFIQSLVTDNSALLESDPDYINQLKALPPKLRKAWLEGDWNIFEGQFFEEFKNDPSRYIDRRFTHVIEPFEVPEGWNIIRSFDFGFAKPFSCDWWAVDYDSRAYLILQLYGCTGTPNEGVKWHPDKIFSEIKRLETEHRWLRGKRITGVADPSIWDRSRGDAIIDFADRHGIYFEKGDNKRISGWMQCHYRLSFDEEGYPMVYFFNSCRAALRTLPLLQFSETNPEDLNTEQEDHFADSFRYFCMSRPISPKRALAAQIIPDDPLELNSKRYNNFSY
ncbi:MAG: phage terminase large subunit [Oscillospiraceae bacterium]|nr:phage terminase large subunit [Oscillospiraceae bacterium]